MRYKITLKPLQPFLFGGDNTYGKIGDKENGTYKTNSRYFPQQSAILGMIKKEIMAQAGVLTRKVRGEWVDANKKNKANDLVGSEKFDITKKELQNFGAIQNISPIFLQKEKQIIIKVANLKKFPLKKAQENCLLKDFTAKDDMFDNYESLDGQNSYASEDIFVPIEQTLNQKQAIENSLYKKTSYLLKDGFGFGFFLECDYELKNSIITLGADRSSFALKVEKSKETLEYKSEYIVLLSDSLITLPLQENCNFAITSEISYQNIINKKGVQKDKSTSLNSFTKSKKVYLYEKGSVIINPSPALIDNLNNKNLQKIGYNIYTTQGEK